MLVKVLLRKLLQHQFAFFLILWILDKSFSVTALQANRRECKFRPPDSCTIQNNKTFKGTKGGRNVTNEL